MSFKYPVEPNSIDSHQVNPYWLAIVEPFTYKDTYNRDTKSNQGSTDASLKDPVKSQEIIIIDNDCIAWQTSGSKGSPNSGLQLNLRHTNINYALKMAPEDWIIFFAFDNYADYKAIKDKALRAQNKFEDAERLTEFKTAPKFIGRISSIIPNKQVDSNGRRSISYSVIASGFSELNSKIYYNPTLHQNVSAVFDNRKNLKSGLIELTLEADAEIKSTFEKLLKIFLGMGANEDFTNATKLKNLPSSPNKEYLVPKYMARFISGKVSGKVFYSDLLNLMVGIQDYSSQTVQNSISGFIPNKLEFYNRIVAPNINYNDVPMWSILNSVSGFPLNEMYTCLRVDSDNFVKPTVVCRQLPFTSNKLSKTGSSNSKIATTAFLSLPRWVISDKLISSINTGRSNSSRYNYVQIVGTQLSGQPDTLRNTNINEAFPPIWDSADIKRSGLNTYIRNVGMFFSPLDRASIQRGHFWNQFMADILFGSHLKYSGTIVTQGIQLPICEGDNCVVDGVIYHIERIAHSGSIDTVGRKTFTTTISVSNGISEQSDNSQDIIYPDSTQHLANEQHVGFNSEEE